MTIKSALALLALLTPAFAQSELARPAPKDAFLFKSGQAWLEREHALEGGRSTLRVGLPRAIHGTLWLGSGSHRVVRAIGRKVDERHERPVESLGDLLLAGEGKEVFLTLSAPRDVQRVGGRLGRVLRDRDGNPTTLCLSTKDERFIYVPLSRVLSATFRDGERPARVAGRRKANALEVTCESEEKPGALRLAWMTGGLAWAPSWQLRIDGTEGRLVGKAVLLNDAVDLENTRVRLVVGYPNLRYGHVSSPLAPDVSFNTFRNAILGQSARQQMDYSPLSNVMGQTIQTGVGFGGPSGGGGISAPLPATSSEDLWIHDAGRLTLKKGERAYLPLTSAKVAVRHRYDWDLADHIDGRARFQPQTESPAIWHELVLRNAGESPWTTAPVLISGPGGPLAQSQIDYTPAGADAEVRLTRALDLVGDSAFEVIERDRETERFFGRNYERIVVRGTLEVTNRKAEKVRLRVTKRLSGEVLKNGDADSVKEEAAGLRGINPRNLLTWNVELEPGATWSAVFEHRVLVSR